jgi:hypothetical protein
VVPSAVLAEALGAPGTVVACRAEEIGGSSGAATGGVTRLTGHARCGGDVLAFAIIAKRLRPLSSGRHAAASADPNHWAYWRREALAYTSGLLPRGPGLAAPRCYGVEDDVVYLADVPWCPEQAAVAATRLGVWQATAAIPPVGWLAGDQLAQRIAVSALDWSHVDTDIRLARIWAHRHDLLDALTPVPRVLSHGDFHAGQLRAVADTTIVLDWSTFGTAPAGADLAHLVLSTVDSHEADSLEALYTAYLDGLGSAVAAPLVRTGYRITVTLTGTSRVHWMLTNGVPVPDGYVDLILDCAP